MKLLAISDLHLSSRINREALLALPPHPDDWLIVAGDMAEKISDITFGFEVLADRFDKVIWAPGNHDLWAIKREDFPNPPRGVARYEALVELARSFGILTPEDPYLTLSSTPASPALTLAPLFLLYDYSFRPESVERADVVAWAREKRMGCADEYFLHPDPYETRDDWCRARLATTEKRLQTIPEDQQTVLINHFPLREELVHIPRAPRFSPWCGTKQTDDWHIRFRAHSAISGHIHIRRTDVIDGTRFEEVSLGYPKQWKREKGIESYFQEIASR